MSEVIVITSGKGGVGKTTTVANLGTALSLENKKTVVVDADIGLRNLDVVMGLENRIVYDIVDVVEGTCKLKQALIKDKRFENLYLLPAAQTRDKNAVSVDQMSALCEKLKEILEEKGAAKVVLADLSREDWAEAVEDSFRYGKIVFASATYDMGIFTPMRDLLLNLKERNYQNKKVAIIENGTWAPNAARCMKEIISTMKNIEIVEPVVTIKSTLKEENIEKLNELAKNLLK